MRDVSTPPPHLIHRQRDNLAVRILVFFHQPSRDVMKIHLIDISRPQGVLWEGGTLSRSLACGSTTRYYLATPNGVCSSHHSELLIPNYTLLRPLAGRRTIARSGALARLRDIATPIFQDPSWVARRRRIGAMGRRFSSAVHTAVACRQRQSRTEPHGGVSNIAPCKRGRAARSLGYRARSQKIAAEQQIINIMNCYSVATPLKLTFYPTLHGATHRLHGATSDTVLMHLLAALQLSLASYRRYGAAAGGRTARRFPYR